MLDAIATTPLTPQIVMSDRNTTKKDDNGEIIMMMIMVIRRWAYKVDASSPCGIR